MLKFNPVMFCALLLFVSACSGTTSKFEADLAELKKECETLGKELKSLSVDDILNTYKSAESLTDSLKKEVDKELLPLEFAKEMDHFLTIKKNAANLEEQYQNCSQAQLEQSIRLNLLASDIESGSGERAQYSRNIANEKQNLTRIQEHFRAIQTRFIQLKEAIPVFQANLEEHIHTKGNNE